MVSPNYRPLHTSRFFCRVAPDILTSIICRKRNTATHVPIFVVTDMAAEHDLIPRLLSLLQCLVIALLKTFVHVKMGTIMILKEKAGCNHLSQGGNTLLHFRYCREKNNQKFYYN